MKKHSPTLPNRWSWFKGGPIEAGQNKREDEQYVIQLKRWKWRRPLKLPFLLYLWQETRGLTGPFFHGEPVLFLTNSDSIQGDQYLVQAHMEKVLSKREYLYFQILSKLRCKSIPIGIYPSGMLKFWMSINAICQTWQKLIVYSRQQVTLFSICSLLCINKVKLLCPPKKIEPLFLLAGQRKPRTMAFWAEQWLDLSWTHPLRALLFMLWGLSRLGNWPR